MGLVKTSILTAISTVIRVFTSFIINKLVSIYVGPSGLAIIGQFQNFVIISSTVGSGAISQGVVKYTSEYRDSYSKKRELLSTAVVLTLISSMLVGLFLNIFAPYLSYLILKSDIYSHLFNIFGFTIILFSLNTLLMSILNGQKEIKKYITVNIISSLFSLLFTSFLIINFGLLGSLYAMVLNLSVIFFVTLFFVLKSSWFKIDYFTEGFSRESGIKLGKYALMAVVSAIVVPLSQMVVREYIGSNLGWSSAGYWQGIWYISSMYLMVVTTSLGVYYLPRLSEIEDKSELKEEMLYGYRVILPIVIFLAFGIYIFREYIVYIAFTKSFMPMVELFKWQLIGDVVKISSWLLSYLMLAKAMTRLYIYTEIVFSLLFVVLSILFINEFGLIGVTYAFCLNYLIYLVVMITIFRKGI